MGPLLPRGAAHHVAVPLADVPGAAVRQQAAARVPGPGAGGAGLVRAQRAADPDIAYPQSLAGHSNPKTF